MSGLLLLMVTTLIPGQSLHAEVVDRIVAVVNQSVITLSELEAAATAMTREGGPIAATPPRSTVLDRLIERKLVEQASTNAGITVSEQEVDAAIEDVLARNRVSREQLMTALADSGITYKEYRERLKTDIGQVKFTSRQFRSKAAITESDIKSYYHQNREKFHGPASYRLAMISIDERERASAEKAASALYARLQKGEDFGEVARRFSGGPNAAEGGDLGFLRESELDRSIKAVVERLAVGEFSPVITTFAGLSIIRLLDKKVGKVQPFDEVKESIHEILFQRIVDERYRAWLETVKKSSHIDIRL